ncbi:MAG: glycoside hydrolase family 88 protein [Bacteroidales bacterium]|nr:glycoside hydrolase family 88 protein [Bacteroidales bacterium]
MKKSVLIISCIALPLLVCSCGKCGLYRMIDKAFENAQAQYIPLADSILTACPGRFPHSLKEDGSMTAVKSNGWTSGFFPGSLWYIYEWGQNPEIRDFADKFTAQMEKEQYNTHTHDVGFMMYCSYGNSYRLCPDTLKRRILINSANSLKSRMNPVVGCIRSWDGEVKPGWHYPVIIDNMMNLELLMWAFTETGDSTYLKTAVCHADHTILNHFREDYSSYHVVNYDPVTGDAMFKGTHQGLSDDSAWARGQAWGLYGYTMMYRFTSDDRYLHQAGKIAEYITSFPVMPADKIPYWDFMAPKDGEWTPRDASAGALYASALLELSTYVEADLSEGYREYAIDILKSLSSKEYTAARGTNGRFLLRHSTTSFPAGREIDKPLNYADYYYLEALLRLKNILDSER